MAKSHQKLIEAYVKAFTSLRPGNIDTLLALVEIDVVFVDPFNKLRGKAAFGAVFEHMFETTIEPQFTVSDVAHSTVRDRHVTYLRWQMTARTKGWPSVSLELEGMSEIHIGDTGLVSHHIDHWDSASQLLSKLPFIGALVRQIMRIFVVRTN
ncbi:MAG: nuclear transport factor 2 family protein [SAR116 cluster bacterium]|nr:MAG: nuclear transport factor 2 family protein [SAR116 cluster bacterium]|tara:strand:- start:1288 stop:1746 length:459 start_codon:yes stop_codon:yes gene_type:complete